MSARKLFALLCKLLRHLRPAPVPPVRRAVGSSLEPLESRIAPAVLVSPYVVTYHDTAGDLVTIKSSLPIFKSASPDALLTFNTGKVDGTTTPQELQAIDLSTLNSSQASGESLSITTVSGHLANVGVIYSSFAMGHVTVQGDLGRIIAGDSTGHIHTTGLASLAVNSLGAQGLATQPAKGSAAVGNASLVSNIQGGLGKLSVTTDIDNAQLTANNSFGTASHDGIIGSIAIGGGFNGGSVISAAGMGSVRVGGSVTGATITSGGAISSVSIGGSLVGGTAALSGSIDSTGNIGSVTIGGDITGGAGANSGSVRSGGSLSSLSAANITGYVDPAHPATESKTVGMGSGSVVLGAGGIHTTATLGHLTLTGSLTGGTGDSSGEITDTSLFLGNFEAIRIGKMLSGGAGNNSGEISSSNSIGSVQIGTGISGSSGQTSGVITSRAGIASVVIESGGLTGGAGSGSGSISAIGGTKSNLPIVTVNIQGGIAGGGGDNSGDINSGGGIHSLYLGGSLTGGAGMSSGGIIATGGEVGSATITGSIIGGTKAGSGEINVATLGRLTVDGDLVGGSGTAANAGQIVGSKSLGSITIGGGINGGPGTGAGDGAIVTGNSSSTTLASLASLKINSGGITGGAGPNSGALNLNGNLGLLSVTGGITGGAGANSGALNVTGKISAVDVTGALVAGTGPGSGSIFAGASSGSISLGTLGAGTATTLAQVSVSGDLASFTASGDFGLVTVLGTLGRATIKGDLTGTTLADSGSFQISSALHSFSVTGQILGGSGDDSGAVFAGLDQTSSIGSVTVAGGITGGTPAPAGTVVDSGGIYAGANITSISLGHLLGGGAGSTDSGSIQAAGAIGTLKVTGLKTTAGHPPATPGIVGGAGAQSGQVQALSIARGSVLGPLAGGSGAGSGSIITLSSYTPSGDIQGYIGTLSISGGVTGGSGPSSGLVSSAGNLHTLSVFGDVKGGTGSLSGSILAGVQPATAGAGAITSLRITGSLIGADVAANTSLSGSGYIQATHISSLAITGSVTSGTLAPGATAINDGAIRASQDIASLTVGSLSGTAANPVAITAQGQAAPTSRGDFAFGKISISGSVSYADILAGYDLNGTPQNRAASIAAVVVGGSWSGSNLAAGVEPDSNGLFGTAGDKLIPATSGTPATISKIASVIIKGHVENTGVPGDQFGFVANQITAFSAAGHALKLSTSTTAPDVITPVDDASDATLREVIN